VIDSQVVAILAAIRFFHFQASAILIDLRQKSVSQTTGDGSKTQAKVNPLAGRTCSQDGGGEKFVLFVQAITRLFPPRLIVENSPRD